MAHFKMNSRLGSRAGTTPQEWLKVCSQIGRQVNDWSGRYDLAVYGGEDSAEGQAVAAFYHDISEIEINVKKAFGYVATPEMIGDFTERETQLTYPNASGVVYHEALHAKYTNWDRDELQKAFASDNIVGQFFMSMEESRIERNGVLDNKKNKEFLRASGLNMALEDLTDESLGQMSDKWATANMALLSIARYDAGVLYAEDIASIYKHTLEVLGEDLFKALQEKWVEFQNLTIRSQDRAVEVAREFVELLREADPEGEPEQAGCIFTVEAGGDSDEDSEEESEDSPQGNSKSGEAWEKLLEELENQATRTEMDSEDKIADQRIKEKWEDEVKQRKEVTNAKTNRKETARQIFDKRYDEFGSGSSSRIQERRNPTGEERALAVKLGKELEKAKYRERSEHTRQSQIPMGKLNVRNAIQNQAMEARGQMPNLPSWKRKVRKHTDDPTLTMGVLVDISGSMGHAMEAMATTAWVLGEAGHRIQADTAMVYFGTGVFPTLRKGQRLPQVNVYSAPDGTEEFAKAFEALDGELGLTFGTGVRMLVVVSDCQFTGKQDEKLKQTLAECKKAGVAVLIISPEGCWSLSAKRAVEATNYGVHLDQLKVGDIAKAVGQSAIEALSKVA
jgi:hypothetical protein